MAYDNTRKNPVKAGRRTPSKDGADRGQGGFSKRAGQSSGRDDTFFVCGIHPVEEALANIPRARLSGAKLWLAQTRAAKDVEKILSLAQDAGVKVCETSMQALSERAGEVRHQGVILDLPPFVYADLDDVLENLSPQPLVVVLDHIEDPHNLGAIIRSAAAFGADAVVIAKDRAAQITSTSLKTSAGQAYRIPICRVANIAQCLRNLKTLDFHVVGTALEGETLPETSFHCATALVMGAEGDGMKRLTRTLCDTTVRIPQNPGVESLNVSVAAAIILYHASLQRTLNWR